jgi:hypothetical protein
MNNTNYNYGSVGSYNSRYRALERNNNNSSSNRSNNNSYPEPTPEDWANYRNYQAQMERYGRPIFLALNDIHQKESQFRHEPHVNNLIDLFDALVTYKNAISNSDKDDIRETYQQVADMYEFLIEMVAGSQNSNVSSKSNEFSNIIAQIDQAQHIRLQQARTTGGRRRRYTKKHKKTRKAHKSRKSNKKH